MGARERMIGLYDQAMVTRQSRIYDGSGFFNFGYWGDQPASQREASEALVDRLTARIATPGRRILDVACGTGASTRRLTSRYAPDMITAINISEVQLAEARRQVPGCAFLRMDAARLGFANDTFDAVICVEAAFHFDTREAFLREALRVLKPGGSLAVADMLHRRIAAPLARAFHLPAANYERGLASYRRRLEAVGFVEVEAEDATDVCLRPFLRGLAGWPAAQRAAGHIGLGKAIERSLTHGALALYFAAVFKTYVLASARKPALQ